MKCTDNLLAWEALLISVKTGNISRTAALMETDIAKISRLLSSLEKEVGFPFFDKTRRPLVPTPECVELVREVEPHLFGFQRIASRRWKKSGTLVVRFAAPIELALEFFSNELCRYSQEHPDVQFSIEPEISADELRAGKAEIAVLNRLPEDMSGLSARPYGILSAAPLASAQYLDYYGEPRTPEELRDHAGLLHRTANAPVTERLYKDGKASGPLEWKNVFFTHDQLTIKRLLLGNQGIAVDLYTGHVISELRSGAIVPILPGWRRAPWNMFVATRLEDELKSPALRHFIRWLMSFAVTASRTVHAACDAALEEAYARRR